MSSEESYQPDPYNDALEQLIDILDEYDMELDEDEDVDELFEQLRDLIDRFFIEK